MQDGMVRPGVGPQQRVPSVDSGGSAKDRHDIIRYYWGGSGTELGTGLRQPPLSAMPAEYLTPAIEARAVEVLTLLADRGRHRAPSIPDLIIAATAELAGLIVLHLDKDFEVIADITGQPVERLNAN